MQGFRIGVLTSLMIAVALVVALYALAPSIDRERIAAGDGAAIASAAEGFDGYPFVRFSDDLRGQVGALEASSKSGDSSPETGTWRLETIARIAAQIRLLAIAILGSVVLFWLGVLAKAKLRPPSRAYNNVVALFIVGSVALPLWACQNLHGLLLVLPSLVGLVVATLLARRQAITSPAIR